MIDIKDLRNRPDYYRSSTEAKNGDPSVVDQLLKKDEERRAFIGATEDLRAEQNILSKKIPTATAEEKAELLSSSKTLSDKYKEHEARLSVIEKEYMSLICQIPNPLHESVNVGKTDEDNEVARVVGEKPTFSFEPKEHWELAEQHDLIDMERGAKVSGNRFIYLKNDLVLMEMALINWVLQKLAGKGFIPMIPPYMVRERAMFGTGYFPDAENGVYVVNPEDENLYLTGTSEVSLVNYHDNETLDVKDLPLRYVGFSTCFRREAGSYGKDVKGMLRVHQFEKVEMVSFCHPDKSWEEHEYMRTVEEEIMSELELPYQLLNICSGDLGGSAAKKYDIEAWLPGQGKYREMTSTSNTTDYQSRRLNIRYRNEEGKVDLLHILNGTATSMRPLIAIMENNQQEDGTIRIPKVLVPFMGGKEFIGKA